ncbi:MAG TPA: ABC transporter permease [Woeseiaceae bacterium]|nr:ABC transporter permease [Woeseiaceae bacterium]
MENKYLIADREDHSLTVSLKGGWVLANVPDLEAALAGVDTGGANAVTFKCGGLQDIDIAGAWVLFRRSQELESRGSSTEFQGFKAAHFKFLQSIADVNQPPTVALTNVTTSLPQETDTTHAIKVADIVITDDGRGENKLSLGGADAELFEIVGSELYLAAGARLDFETKPTLDVTVEVDDVAIGASPDDTAPLSIAVTSVNESPGAVFDKAVGDDRPSGEEQDLPPVEEPRIRHGLESLGRATTSALQDVGFITTTVLQGITRPSALAFRETVRQVYQTGVQAIPIVCLISFLMGVVIAYQGATQLAKFGADVFVADLVTISVLREMGVIMAAIMVAGRSGSAFAASLGVMKLNEELDALRVMGLNPNQVLVAPRVLGLIVALPLLTGFADLSGLAGGLFLSTVVLDVSMVQFMDRAADSADLATLLVGLVKAPVFALLIGAVGTLRGLQVTSSAEELGRLTTAAVVQAITLIVIADAVFTFIFVRLGI